METSGSQASGKILKALKAVFSKCSNSARREGWNKIMSARGRSEVNKLINNPERQVNVSMFLGFKEWLEANDETA